MPFFLMRQRFASLIKIAIYLLFDSVIGCETLSIVTISWSYIFIQSKSSNVTGTLKRSFRTWILTTGPAYGMTCFSSDALTKILPCARIYLLVNSSSFGSKRLKKPFFIQNSVAFNPSTFF